MSHVIVFGDGTEITAELSGNNYYPDEPVDDELLDDINLIGMTIDGIERENVTCVRHWTDSLGEHIVFRNYTPEELAIQDLDAKIEYIAMMGDIDL